MKTALNYLKKDTLPFSEITVSFLIAQIVQLFKLIKTYS